MVQNETLLNVCDNSGAKLVKCIKILGASKKRYAYLGEALKVSVKKRALSSKLKKGEVCNAVLIRTVYSFKRYDGTFINFNDNAVILLNNKYEFLCTRIFGPVLSELKNNIFISHKLNSLSPNFI